MISTTSKYALRILVALANAPVDEYVLGRALAAATDVPANYLAKLLVTLGNAGLVEAVRGRNGGYRLSRGPGGIRLLDVVELFEGVGTDPSCFLGIHDVCSDETPCSAHHLFRDVRARYVAFLETTSIADAARMETTHPLSSSPS